MAYVYFRLWGEMAPKLFPKIQLNLYCQWLGKWDEML